VVNAKMPISEVEQMNYAQYVLLNRGRRFIDRLQEQHQARTEKSVSTIAQSGDDLDALFD